MRSTLTDQRGRRWPVRHLLGPQGRHQLDQRLLRGIRCGACGAGGSGAFSGGPIHPSTARLSSSIPTPASRAGCDGMEVIDQF